MNNMLIMPWIRQIMENERYVEFERSFAALHIEVGDAACAFWGGG